MNGIDIIDEIYNQIDIDTYKYVDSDILRKLYLKYNCPVCLPNLMIAEVNNSDIRQCRNQEELALKVGWSLDLYHYPLTSPLVSIIIACYNGEKTIQRCLESLYNQTYQPLEIIVVDDGSVDNSFKIITDIFHQWEYCSKNLSYRIEKQKTNKGCYNARNFGLALASGELIGFQDEMILVLIIVFKIKLHLYINLVSILVLV